MTHDSSLIAVPLFIDVTDVMRSMRCSRSRAYEHMRAALGRQPRERAQSRVPLYVWERYVRERFDPEARGAAAERVAKTRQGEMAPSPSNDAAPNQATARDCSGGSRRAAKSPCRRGSVRMLKPR